jgi:signal transduction histidine kinase
LLTEVAEIYGPVVEDAGGTLSIALPDHCNAIVNGDGELLIQLFANLIENSVNHCPTGTKIRVALEDGQAGARVVIGDDGPGIPIAEHENVFHRLYRLEASRSTAGSGLGLSLVAAIAELHGLKIELGDNRPGLLVNINFPGPGARPAV